MGRYFPELTSVLQALGRDAVLDGEIVIAGEQGFDFALLNRTHPAASRVVRLSRETPATFIAFDLLALDGAGCGRNRRVVEPDLATDRSFSLICAQDRKLHPFHNRACVVK